MRRKRLIFFTIALALLALYATLKPTSEQQSAVRTLLQQDEWQLLNSQSWQIDRQNPTEQRHLKAELIRQQQDDLYVEKPELVISKPDHQLKLQSQDAHIQQQTLFHFSGDVVITSRFLDEQQNTQLNTDTILYNQALEQLTTASPVTLTAHQSTTTGIGLMLDLKQQQIELHSKVKTLYEP